MNIKNTLYGIPFFMIAIATFASQQPLKKATSKKLETHDINTSEPTLKAVVEVFRRTNDNEAWLQQLCQKAASTPTLSEAQRDELRKLETTAKECLDKTSKEHDKAVEEWEKHLVTIWSIHRHLADANKHLSEVNTLLKKYEEKVASSSAPAPRAKL